MEEKEYIDLAVKLENVDSRAKSNEHRISELESEMHEVQDMQLTLVKLANGVENMATQLVTVKDDIKEVKHGQDELNKKVALIENRPAHDAKLKMDSIRDKLVWLFVGGVAAYLLSLLLPTIF